MGIICLEYCESFQKKTTDFYGNNFDWHSIQVTDVYAGIKCQNLESKLNI